MNVLVIDVGTSSLRGVLFGACGQKLCSRQIGYSPVYRSDGRVEQAPEQFLDTLTETVKTIAAWADENSEPIELVSITSQRSSIAPIDAAGNPLADFIMWQDTRNASLVSELEKHNDFVFKLSGTRVNTVFSGAKMAWIEKEEPGLAARSARYVTIPELLIHQMCGERAIDQTYASRSNLMDIRLRDWSTELLDLFGVPAGKLSRVVEPGSAVGCVTEEFSLATGLACGIPVVSAGGDQQCGALGQGIFALGDVSIVTGTGAFMETAVYEVPDGLSPRVICNASSLAGAYTLEASVPTCCSAFDWYRRTFCPEMSFDDIALAVEAEHRRCAPSIVLPHFQGRGTPDWNPRARGVLAGIDLSATRESLLYSLLVGIFTEVRINLDSFEDLVPLTHGRISGGLTGTPAINQVQADVYGLELSCADDTESAARGALISALVGQGVYADARSAFRAVSADVDGKKYVPDNVKHRKLAELKAASEELYRSVY